jgi:phage portal protein BeeE
VIPLATRTAKALSRWLAPAYPVSGFSLTPSPARSLELRPDLDALPALAPERETLWSSLEKTTFLTANEKRTLAGFAPLARGDGPDACRSAVGSL